MHLLLSTPKESPRMNSLGSFAPRPVHLDLPPSMAHEIGLIVAHWSYLESQIDRVISYLLRLGSRNGAVAVFHMPLESRLNVAHELLGRHNAIPSKDFAALKTDILNARIERDQIVEASWVWDAGSRAHYPCSPFASGEDHHARMGRTATERLTHAAVRSTRSKVDLLSQRASGLFHAVVTALPSNIKLSSALTETADQAPHRELRRAAG